MARPLQTHRVAIHGDEAQLHDAVAGQRGAFEQLRAELAQRQTQREDMAITSETLVTAANVGALARIVDFAGAHGVSRCIFIAPVDRVAPASIVEFTQLIPAVRAALARCRDAGIEGRVEQLPRCLLEDDADALIPPSQATPGDPRSSCLFEARCGESEGCPGLAHAYVARYGWELRRLRPTPRERPWADRLDRCASVHAAWLALLGPTSAAVEAVELDRLAFRYTMRVPGGDRLVIELRARSTQAPAFARSRSFNITYTRVEGQPDPQALARFVDPIAAAIIANDDGSLDLDPRHGLAPLPPR